MNHNKMKNHLILLKDTDYTYYENTDRCFPDLSINPEFFFFFFSKSNSFFRDLCDNSLKAPQPLNLSIDYIIVTVILSLMN